MATSQEPSSFPLFMDLPKEIRLMVWEQAIPDPRIVHIQQRRIPRSTEDWNLASNAVQIKTRRLVPESLHGPVYKNNWAIRSDCPIPDVLLACKESHSVALKFYSRSFVCSESWKISFPQTWFDFKRDVFYLNLESVPERNRRGNRQATAELRYILLDEMFCEDFKIVENLAIFIPAMVNIPGENGFDANIYTPSHQFAILKDWLGHTLRFFRSVKRLIFVYRHMDICSPGEFPEIIRQGRLEFLEGLPNVEEAISIYKDVIHHQKLEFESTMIRRDPLFSRLDLRQENFDNDWRFKNPYAHSNAKMPQLEHVLIGTTRMRQWFVTAERLYKSELSLNGAARAFQDTNGQEKSVTGLEAWIKEAQSERTKSGDSVRPLAGTTNAAPFHLNITLLG